MIDQPDPYPRELLDLWPLHDARQELLEEIVSQPGPAESTPTRRILVPVGIAAALLLVAGGAWAAISAGGDDRNGDTVVAASATPTATDTHTKPPPPAGSTSPSTTKPDQAQRPQRARNDSRAMTLRNLEQCLRGLRSEHVGPKDYLRLRRMTEHGKHGATLYLVRKDHRIVAVDGRCRTFAVKDGRMPRH